MPITHDPHSGKFMPGPHADKGGGGGGGSSGGSSSGGGDGGGGKSNPVMEHHTSKHAEAASEHAKKEPSKAAHIAAAKAHSEAMQHHMNAGFDASGKTAEHHQAAQEHHAAKQQEHIKAAREMAGVKKESPKLEHDPHGWEQHHYGEWQKNLTHNERAAIQDYTGEGYKQINANLRKDPNFSNQTTQHLDAALAKTSAPEAFTAYRTVGAGVLSQLHENTTFTDHGYVSTALKSDTFKPQSGKTEATMMIHIQKGAKGAAIDQLSSNRSEKEFLLPRGSRFKVIRVVKSEHGPAHVEAELL